MDKWAKLTASLGIDAVGILTFGAGELLDLVWAPLSALAVFGLYRKPVYSFVAFGEEILPGLDVIPTATLAWLDENGFFSSRSQKPKRSHPVHGPNRSLLMVD